MSSFTGTIFNHPSHMPLLYCSSCASAIKAPEPGLNAVVFCGSCGKCLQSVTSWIGSTFRDPLVVFPNAPDENLAMLESMVKDGQHGPGRVVTLPSDLPDRAHQLGALLTVHQTSSVERIGYVVAGACFILASPALLAFLAATQKYKAEAVILIIVFPFLGSGLLVRGLWNMVRRLVVLVFSEGFVRVRPGPIAAWSWVQLAVYYKKSKGASLSYILENRDGERITLRGSDMAWFTNLGGKIEQTIWQRCYPDVLTSYESGGVVRFGRLGVSQAGLLKDNKIVPWNEVEWVAVDQQNNFVVSKKRAMWFWCVIPIARIPNYCIFRALVEDNIRFTSFRRR